MSPRRERPRIRLLFDEVLPPGVARALRELGFNTSHVGHLNDEQPPRGSDDATILAHAIRTGQIIVTSNHDMVLLCAEQGQSVVWVDPYGRQLRHDEFAVLAFRGIQAWERLIDAAEAPVCLRVLRTKVEVLALDLAASSAERRMRTLQARVRRRRRPTEVPGQLGTDGPAG